MPYVALIEKSYLDFAESLAVNAPFVAILIFAVQRNHIVFGCVCLFLYNFLSLGLFARSY